MAMLLFFFDIAICRCRIFFVYMEAFGKKRYMLLYYFEKTRFIRFLTGIEHFGTKRYFQLKFSLSLSLHDTINDGISLTYVG